MPAGRVKFFDLERRFGFIKPNAGGADVFVHFSEVAAANMRTLEQDQTVLYDVAINSRNQRPTAINLRLVAAVVDGAAAGARTGLLGGAAAGAASASGAMISTSAVLLPGWPRVGQQRG